MGGKRFGRVVGDVRNVGGRKVGRCWVVGSGWWVVGGFWMDCGIGVDGWVDAGGC